VTVDRYIELTTRMVPEANADYWEESMARIEGESPPRTEGDFVWRAICVFAAFHLRWHWSPWAEQIRNLKEAQL
jgi:hypothetical protein